MVYLNPASLARETLIPFLCKVLAKHEWEQAQGYSFSAPLPSLESAMAQRRKHHDDGTAHFDGSAEGTD